MLSPTNYLPMPKKKLTDPFVKKDHKLSKRTEFYDTFVSGLALRVTPAGSKTFVYRYRFNTVKRYTIGKYPNISLADAREEARELHKKVYEGIDPMEEKKRKKSKETIQTFDHLIDVFKKNYLPDLREKTSNEYERIIDAEIKPVLKGRDLEHITKSDILDLLDNIAITRGKKIMSNRVRSVLSRIYTFGMERDLTKKNPVKKTQVRTEAEKRKDRYYTEPEIKALWEAFNMQREPARSVFKILLLCGQRSKETRHMKWENINDGVWTIPASLSKSDRAHDVPLPSMAIDIIEKLRSENEDSPYVFESPRKKGAPLNSLKRPKKSVRKISKVGDFTPHDLRRTATTYLAKLNVNRTVLGKIINHKGVAGDGQVIAIYDRHKYIDERKKALEKWSNHLFNIIQDKKERKENSEKCSPCSIATPPNRSLH